jgi:hypothetical protein
MTVSSFDHLDGCRREGASSKDDATIPRQVGVRSFTEQDGDATVGPGA